MRHNSTSSATTRLLIIIQSGDIKAARRKENRDTWMRDLPSYPSKEILHIENHHMHNNLTI